MSMIWYIVGNMKTMARRNLFVLLYLVVSFLNFGALNADVRTTGCDRRGSSVAMAMALLPVIGTAGAIFGTGFFEYGFSWEIGCK